MGFQSTHPRGVRPWATWWLTQSCWFQSTHPRGVRLDVTEETLGRIFVSIHAPTRGATGEFLGILLLRLKFQSTHPRGVRPSMRFQFLSNTPCFNPRTHEGCDRSAHRQGRPQGCFNPRTHEGCDMKGAMRKEANNVFQSTHPRGVRPQDDATYTVNLEFQSTHPRGVRHTTNK